MKENKKENSQNNNTEGFCLLVVLPKMHLFNLGVEPNLLFMLFAFKVHILNYNQDFVPVSKAFFFHIFVEKRRKHVKMILN